MVDDTQTEFIAAAREYYHNHGRHDLPWRQLPADGTAAYQIMVSELMLQQTQVGRVIPKYQEFLTAFPTLADLAAAPLGEVLRAWSGLGYNRRAKFLQLAAQQITAEYDGQFPTQLAELITLPGIGINTAGAILAYAYDQPAVFIETNIRTVFIHHFFDDKSGIADAAIMELVIATLDHEHPREWYWALMDYGAHLKQTVGNRSRQSAGYSRQSKFEGSRRQIRGQILRLLGSQPRSMDVLHQQIPDPRLSVVVEALLDEKLIQQSGRIYHL